jgi:hypothetical protein
VAASIAELENEARYCEFIAIGLRGCTGGLPLKEGVFKRELQLIGSMVNREPLPWNIHYDASPARSVQMLGVFAEFERAIILDRINAGIARAREKGTKSGKAIGRARVDPENRGCDPSVARERKRDSQSGAGVQRRRPR